MRETNLGWVSNGIGSPSALGVSWDERESAGTVFRMTWEGEATEDLMMKICFQ